MIHSLRGVLHLRYLCYIHERDAHPLVVPTNQIGVVQNDVTPICYHERVSGSTWKKGIKHARFNRQHPRSWHVLLTPPHPTTNPIACALLWLL